MTKRQGEVQVGPWEDADALRVVRALERSGPRSISALADDPELARWPAQRVQRAVVIAWSRNLIFVDAGDQLVPLPSPRRQKPWSRS